MKKKKANSPWIKRYMVCTDTQLIYWKQKEDYQVR